MQRTREELEEIEAELKRKTEQLQSELEATKARQRLLEKQVDRMSRQNPQQIQLARSERERSLKRMKREGPRDLIHPSLPPMKSSRTPIRYRGIPQVNTIKPASTKKLPLEEPPLEEPRLEEPPLEEPVRLFLELTSQSKPHGRELLEIPMGKEMNIGRGSWNKLTPEVKKCVHSISYIVERRPGNDFLHVIAKREGLMYQLPNASQPVPFPHIDTAAFRLKPNGTRIGLIANHWDLTMQLVMRPD